MYIFAASSVSCLPLGMTLFVICAPNVWNSRSRSSLDHRSFLKAGGLVCVTWMPSVPCELVVGIKLSEAVLGRRFLEVTGASLCFGGELTVPGTVHADDVAAFSSVLTDDVAAFSPSSSSDSATGGRSEIAEHNLSTQC